MIFSFQPVTCSSALCHAFRLWVLVSKSKTRPSCEPTLKGLHPHLVFPLGLLPFSGQPGLAHLLEGLTRVHDEGQGHTGSAITTLPGEAQEGGPEEGAAAHEGRPHVQRHQDKVQKL